jgi:hypothetical protein
MKWKPGFNVCFQIQLVHLHNGKQKWSTADGIIYVDLKLVGDDKGNVSAGDASELTGTEIEVRHRQKKTPSLKNPTLYALRSKSFFLGGLKISLDVKKY